MIIAKYQGKWVFCKHNMAPIMVILVSPVLLKESLSTKQIICVIVALIGMVLVSGVIEVGIQNRAEFKGIVFGLGAAILYASVILTNKQIKAISVYDKTIMQLGIATLVLLPYTLLTESLAEMVFTPLTIIMLMVVSIVHTGIAYALYFGSMKDLKAQTVALFSYIDPIVAIILSAMLLKEKMSVLGIVGALFILGATLISEIPKKHSLNKSQIKME